MQSVFGGGVGDRVLGRGSNCKHVRVCGDVGGAAEPKLAKRPLQLPAKKVSETARTNTEQVLQHPVSNHGCCYLYCTHAPPLPPNGVQQCQ